VKGHVKKNNTTYKLCDVKTLLMEGIQRVDDKMWKKIIKHKKTKEEKFCRIDFIVDDMLTAETQPVVLNIGDTSSDSETTK